MFHFSSRTPSPEYSSGYSSEPASPSFASTEQSDYAYPTRYVWENRGSNAFVPATFSQSFNQPYTAAVPGYYSTIPRASYTPNVYTDEYLGEGLHVFSDFSTETVFHTRKQHVKEEHNPEHNQWGIEEGSSSDTNCFVCPVEDCRTKRPGKPHPNFARKSDYNRHMREVHANTREHNCPRCGKGFKRAEHMRGHEIAARACQGTFGREHLQLRELAPARNNRVAMKVRKRPLYGFSKSGVWEKQMQNSCATSTKCV